jgi:hypothetical protein
MGASLHPAPLPPGPAVQVLHHRSGSTGLSSPGCSGGRGRTALSESAARRPESSRTRAAAGKRMIYGF